MTTSWKTDRRTPYTPDGIRRVPCIRCGAPSAHQWQACADGRRFRAICTACDIELNRLVLEFMGHPDVAGAILRYRETQTAETRP